VVRDCGSSYQRIEGPPWWSVRSRILCPSSQLRRPSVKCLRGDGYHWGVAAWYLELPWNSLLPVPSAVCLGGSLGTDTPPASALLRLAPATRVPTNPLVTARDHPGPLASASAAIVCISHPPVSQSSSHSLPSFAFLPHFQPCCCCRPFAIRSQESHYPELFFEVSCNL